MKHFFDDLYRVNFYICVDYTSDELEKAILDQFGLEFKCNRQAKASVIDIEMDDGRFGLFLNIQKDDLNSLIHELVHLVNKVFQRIGYQPVVDNDEPQAYYTQYLFSKILPFVQSKEIDGGEFKNDKHQSEETTNQEHGIDNPEATKAG